jgi:hypothetical protein
MKRLISILCLFFLAALPAFCADFYVSTAGSDSNPGTQSQPFANIQHAIDACPAAPTASFIHLDASTWNESPNINQKTIALSGDFNGPNGMGGQNATHINGNVTISLDPGSMTDSWGSAVSYLGCRGLVLNGSDYGYPAGGSGFTISYCNISGSNGAGITNNGSVQLDIDNCNINNCSGTSIIAVSRHLSISNCSIYSNEYGIDAGSSNTTLINNNNIYDNIGDGLYWHVQFASFMLQVGINNNTIHDNGGCGIKGLCAYQHQTAIYSNNIYNNNLYGIHYINGIGKTYNNIIQNNGSYGVYVAGNYSCPDLGGGAEGSPGNNTISGNGTYDLYKTGTENVYVKNNNWDSATEAQMASGYQKRTNITRFYDAFDYWQPGDPLHGAFIWMSSFPKNGVLDFAATHTTRVQVSSVGQLKAVYAR